MRRKDFACVLLETKEGKGNWANFFKEKNREFAGVEVSEAAAAELARFLEQICVTLWSLSRMARTWFLSIVDASWWYYPSKLHWVCCLVFKNPTQIVTQCWESSAVLERMKSSLHYTFLNIYLVSQQILDRNLAKKITKKTKNIAKNCWHSFSSILALGVWEFRFEKWLGHMNETFWMNWNHYATWGHVLAVL